MSAEQSAIDLAIAAAHGAMRKKASEVIALDVSERLVLTDVFVVASGSNERQVRAIVDAVEEAMDKAGAQRVRREGLTEARWVLLDYGSVVVHVQHDEDRQYYALERLWADAEVIPIPELPEVEALSVAESEQDKRRSIMSAADVIAQNS